MAVVGVIYAKNARDFNNDVHVDDLTTCQDDVNRDSLTT